MRLYERALPWLDGGDDWAWAASRHAALCKRAGRRDDAVPYWERLWSEGDAAAGLDLAKHYEHHARDLAAAEKVTVALLDGASQNRSDLSHRLQRIRRKRARRIIET